MQYWIAHLGTDFSEPLSLVDLEGTVFDLTGYTTTADVKRSLNGNALESCTITVNDAATGSINVDLTDTQVDSLGQGKFYIDLKVVRNSDSFVYRSELAEVDIREVVT